MKMKTFIEYAAIIKIELFDKNYSIIPQYLE